MKNIKLNFLALASLLIFSASCEDDQEYNVTTNAPVGTFSSDKNSVVEFDNPITSDYENVAICNFTMDRPYKTDMKFKIELVASESTGSTDDFKFNLPASGIDNGSDGYLLKVDKNQTNKVFTFTAEFDDDVEGVETFKFKVTPIADFNGSVAPSSQFFTVSIGNSTSDNLDIVLDWESKRTFKTVDEEEHEFSEFDFDLEVINSSLAVANSSYASAPEKIEFSSSSADGTYFIVPSFYSSKIVNADNAPVEPMLPINFNVTLKVVKKGIFVKEIDMSNIWNTVSGGDEQGNPDAKQLAAYFVKAGTTYTLYDVDDNVLVTGRTSDLANMLKSKKRLKK
jgi:hypothetical protein